MTSTLQTVIERVAAVLRQDVPELQTVFEYVPYKIDNNQLPAAIILPAAGTYHQNVKALTQVVIQRSLTVLVLYTPLLQGREGEAQARTYEVHESVMHCLVNNRSLLLSSDVPPNTNTVYRMALSGDNGLSARNYPNASGPLFVVTDFTISVTYSHPVQH